MGIIDVEGPNGVIKVEIAGEAPTAQERKAIAAGLMRLSTTGSASVTSRAAGSTKPDLATATPAQIREYVRMQQQGGITEDGTKMSPEEYANVYREEGVDYTQGLQDTGKFSRFGYGRMETDEGRANYLRRSVGEDGFRKDALGRFVLTQTGRKNLGMGEGPDVAIDEEGLSWGDVKEFLGQAGLPMAAGIGAGLMASGVGFIPGVAIAAVAGAAGKALDEGIEYAQGLQDQTFEDVMRDSAYEGAFSVLGEGAGRAVSKLAGRIIKGPAGAKGEAAREQFRGLLDQGFVPTVSGGAGPEYRPIMGRLQGVLEGMFPNQKVALQNAEQVVKDLRALRVADEETLSNLSDTLQRDVARVYGTADDDLVKAQRILDTTVEQSLSKVYANLRTEGFVPDDIREMLQLSKRLFDENMDSVYTKVNKGLKGQSVIPTADIKAEVKRLTIDSIADIGSTKFVRMVEELPEYATVLELSRIRTGLDNATVNPNLIAEVNVGALSSLKSSITNAMNKTEVFTKRADQMPSDIFMVGTDFTRPLGEISDDLAILRRANALYRKGMQRFDNSVTQNIIAQARRDGGINEKFVYEQIIGKDNPEAFKQLLRAVRGTKYMKGLEQGDRTASRMSIMGMSVEDARKQMNLLPQGSDQRRLYAQEIQRVEKLESEVAGAAGRGVDRAEELRQNLAKMYLDDILLQSKTKPSPNTGAFVIDPTVLVTKLKSKPRIYDELFKNEKDQLESLISILSRSKTDIAPVVLEEMMAKNPSLSEILMNLKATQLGKEKLDRSQFLRMMADGNVEGVAKAVLQSPENARIATRNISPEAMEGVRDVAMARILRQANISTDAMGDLKKSQQFIDSFTSGRLAENFQTVLNDYGDEALDQLFGKGVAQSLNTIVDNMAKVSNAAIKGKGGLAAASMAAAYAGLAVILNPFSLLVPAAYHFAVSKALRNKDVLKLIMASRNKNTLKQLMSGNFKSGDVIGQGLQAVNQILAQATSYGLRGVGAQGEEETNALQQLSSKKIQEVQQTDEASKMLSDLGKIGKATVGMVTDPMGTQSAPAAAGMPPARTQISPILVPNPTTRATFGQ